MPYRAATWEGPGLGRRERGWKGKCGKARTVVFSGRNWSSRVSRFQIGFLNSFTRIQGMGAVHSSWLPGPGVVRAGEYLENKNLIWEGGKIWVGLALDWFVCI